MNFNNKLNKFLIISFILIIIILGLGAYYKKIKNLNLPIDQKNDQKNYNLDQSSEKLDEANSTRDNSLYNQHSLFTQNTKFISDITKLTTQFKNSLKNQPDNQKEIYPKQFNNVPIGHISFNQTDFMVNIYSYSQEFNLNSPSNIMWRININPDKLDKLKGSDIEKTQLFWSNNSIQEPSVNNYKYFSKTFTGNINSSFSYSPPNIKEGEYYFRALALINSKEYWSEEVKIIVSK